MICLDIITKAQRIKKIRMLTERILGEKAKRESFMDIDKLLFSGVVCRAYLRKSFDGIFVETVLDDNMKDMPRYYLSQSGKEIKELTQPGNGGTKRYYEREEKRFDGVVVGIKEVAVEARLVLAEEVDENGCINRFVKKTPTVTEVCALVYYGNLLKRYVPISDIVFPKLDEMDARNE